MNIKRTLILILFSLTMLVVCISACAEEMDQPTTGQPSSGDVIHVATALDHVTVLEFGEPVTMAAAGSTAFEIERLPDKVLIRPLKSGASTDLFVWTGTRRLSYELDPPGEVKNMNFAIESRAPAPQPAPDANARLTEIADMLLTRAFLGTERVDSSSIKDEKHRVTVRIEHIFESNNTLYIHYTVRNRTDQPYRVSKPEVSLLTQEHQPVSLIALKGVQLSHKLRKKMRSKDKDEYRRLLDVALSETLKTDLQPGEQTVGVVALRNQALRNQALLNLAIPGSAVRDVVPSPSVIQLTFGAERGHEVSAALVY